MSDQFFESMTTSPTMVRFAIALTVIVIVSHLSKQVRLPAVVGFVLAGMLFGPNGGADCQRITKKKRHPRKENDVNDATVIDPAPSPCTTERAVRRRGDEPRSNSAMRKRWGRCPERLERGECSERPQRAASQSHGRNFVVRGLQPVPPCLNFVVNKGE